MLAYLALWFSFFVVHSAPSVHVLVPNIYCIYQLSSKALGPEPYAFKLFLHPSTEKLYQVKDVVTVREELDMVNSY